MRATKKPKPRRSKASRRSRSMSPWPISWRAMILAAMCVVGGVAIITARSSSRADLVALDAPTDTGASPDEAPTVASTRPKRKPAPLAPVRASAGSTASLEAAESMVETPANEPAPAETSLAATAMKEVPNAAPVTITGCLELAENTFRLKDTSGVDAPRARSWRSGFLKKRLLSIELVDETSTLKLPEYVGHRVVATGVLINRELRAHSLHRVSASCK